jgi:hypothetical protein
MEFVALGILGLFAITNRPTAKQQQQSEPEKQDPTPDIRQLEDQFKQDVDNHMNSHNVVMPYFRSLKSQNTNDHVKDRRLGTFTGVNNDEYRKKQEQEAPPPVKDLTNIYGTTFQPDMQRYQHYVAGSKNHNVSPVVKQYVGPGLGIDAHTPAEGGFHSSFRILPDNVNGYRKNTFGGTVLSGASTIQARENESCATRTMDRSLTDAELAQLGARGNEFGAVTAHTTRPQTALSPNNRDNTCGSLLGVSGSTPGNYVMAQSTRTDDRTAAHVPGQLFRGMNGGYASSQFEVLETERETANCHRTNVHGNQFGTYTSFDKANPTMREQQQTQAAGVLTGFEAPGVRNFEARPTHKQNTLCDYTGNAGFSAGHTLADTELHRSTMRDNEYHNNSGPGGSVIPGAANYAIGAQVYGAREQTTVTDYVPNQARNTTNARVWGAVTQFQSDANASRVCSNPQAVGVESHSHVSQLGVTQHKDQIVENTRDFGYVPANPLRTNILVKN